ncbi:tetratricopeptide repeat protein [Ferribacterium limneticum]|uniref:tetratricopeptide repeat protein n=1 Tax=Ferribacterium limneticum TaxID=76259 RepID=UPI001CFC459C|nr:tetratricopeptide repeat protein [Ferribacterium limneticum]UCV20033.1 tetratricopeptide repeat protein [Ferribacterium limneticum]
MIIHDDLNLSYSGASAESLGHFRRALRQFQCYIEDPVASVDAAINASPEFVMGHILKAYLHLLGTEPAAIPVARACLAATVGLPANTRERGHIDAVAQMLDGQWRRAGRLLEDVSIDHPHDILALQAGHLADFYVGNSRLLRDRIARALPAWSPDLPGYHALLAMHAFGLEETADYTRAEAQGRAAVELEPRDGWAQHAVAHVMEMQCRTHDGIAWMRADPAAWSTDSFFKVHLWWHLALFHLELGEIDEVLALFDGPIHGERSTMVLDMIDASALLWRLHLRGVDLGQRWSTLADGWQPLATAGTYAFNDVHAVMAFVGARRPEAIAEVLQTQEAVLLGNDDNEAFTREVGHPLTLALKAFGQGAYGDTVRLLRPLREIAHRFGGSHAQRDLLDLTLIEAALRTGQHNLATALCAERLPARGHSPLTRQLLRRCEPLSLAA